MTRLFLALAAAVLAGQVLPARQPATFRTPIVCEAAWRDPARDRIVPVRIRMPAGTGKVPVILFSHGLGGSLDAGTLWAEAWAKDGNAVIHLQHAGSDSGILRTGGLRAAVTLEQLEARADDVHFVIDMVAKRQGERLREGACDLGRIDLTRIGVAGHSFGAQTVLAVAGQRYPLAGLSLADRRVRAALALSPQPAIAQVDAIAFGGIIMPFFSITGTKAALPWLNRVTPKDRERPFRAMAPGPKYLLVMRDATHAMFSGQDNLFRNGTVPPPDLRRTVARATTLFWRWSLRGDAAARVELNRLSARLRPGDRFERR